MSSAWLLWDTVWHSLPRLVSLRVGTSPAKEFSPRRPCSNGYSMNRRFIASAVALLTVCGMVVVAVPFDAEPSSGWGSAELLDPARGYCTYPRTVVDDDGNGMAVWGQFDGVSTIDLMASRYIAGEGWTDAQVLDPGSLELMEAPSAAVDTNGNVTVVWGQNVGPSYWIYSTQYRPGLGWTQPEVVQDDTSLYGTRPSVATGGHDRAMAVWTQSDTNYVNVSASLYVPGVGWGPSELIEDDDSGNPSYAQVAMDAEGNAVAVWRVWASPIYDVWANEYLVGEGWGTAHPIETVYSGTSSIPNVAMDDGGNATVIWQENIDAMASLVSCRYTVGTGWADPDLVEHDDTGRVLSWDVASDIDGRAIAVWAQSDGVRGNILSSHFVPGTGWEDPQQLEDDDSNAATPSVSVDDAGNAVVVWTQFDGYRYSVYANEYDVASGWGGSEIIEEFTGQAEQPWVATGGAGTSIAVWLQYDGLMQRACANTFVAPDLSPPVLVVDEPISGTTVQVPVVTVTGVTEPGATLSVGGVLAVVDGSTGAYSVNVALSVGTNTIEVVATDSSGNPESVSIAVTFDDPVPGLWEELAVIGDDLGDVVADLVDVWSSVNATAGDVDELQSSLDDVFAELSSLEEQIQSILSDIDDMDDAQTSFGAELEVLLSYVDSVSESLNDTQVLLDETLQNLIQEMENGTAESEDLGDSVPAFVLGLVGGLVGAIAIIALVRMLSRNRSPGRGGGRSPPE